MRNVSLKISSTVKEIGKRAFYRRVTPAYGGYLSLIVEPGSYAYDYAKKNTLSMDLGETTILYTTCMNKGCTATKKDTIPATGHKLEEYTKYEANSHKGTRYIYCVNCNYSRAEAVIYVD